MGQRLAATTAESTPDDAVLFDLLADWAPDETTRHRILVATRQRSNGFPQSLNIHHSKEHCHERKSDPLSDIQRDFARVSPEIVKKAAGFQAAILADVAGRRGTLNGRIRGLCALDEVRRPGAHGRGPAGRQPDDPRRDGDREAGRRARGRRQGRSDLRADGRDHDERVQEDRSRRRDPRCGRAATAEEICELGFPVFSVGTNPNGPTKFVPGRINWPISVGGNRDAARRSDRRPIADGVVVDRAREGGIAARARRRRRSPTRRSASTRSAGARASRPAWLDGALRAAGVLKEGETL